MNLSPTAQKFVLHWGEMGTRWGVNRTVAQIHALLYLASEPLSADDIVETLGVARSNVSNSLKELQSWKLVRVARAGMAGQRDLIAGLDVAQRSGAPLVGARGTGSKRFGGAGATGQAKAQNQDREEVFAHGRDPQMDEYRE